MHGDAGHLAVNELALARVQTNPHLESQLRHGLGDGTRAADGPGRAVEGGEEAVAGCVHLPAAIANQLTADQFVVAQQELSPGPVAENRRPLAGADDVREEDR